MLVTCPHCNGGLENCPDIANTLVGCPYCGQQIQMPPFAAPMADAFTPRVSSRPLRRSQPAMDPWVAVLLSLLIVGLPQILLGHVAKGLALLFLTVILAVPTMGLACLIMWPVAAIDAYVTAANSRR